MAEQRSLTIRIRIDGRTESEERAILEAIRSLLARLDGEPRPVLERAHAVRESVSVVDQSGNE